MRDLRQAKADESMSDPPRWDLSRGRLGSSAEDERSHESLRTGGCLGCDVRKEEAKVTGQKGNSIKTGRIMYSVVDCVDIMHHNCAAVEGGWQVMSRVKVSTPKTPKAHGLCPS